MIVFIDDIPHNYNSLEKNERYTANELHTTDTTSTTLMLGTRQATRTEMIQRHSDNNSL